MSVGTVSGCFLPAGRTKENGFAGSAVGLGDHTIIVAPDLTGDAEIFAGRPSGQEI